MMIIVIIFLRPHCWPACPPAGQPARPHAAGPPAKRGAEETFLASPNPSLPLALPMPPVASLHPCLLPMGTANPGRTPGRAETGYPGRGQVRLPHPGEASLLSAQTLVKETLFGPGTGGHGALHPNLRTLMHPSPLTGCHLPASAAPRHGRSGGTPPLPRLLRHRIRPDERAWSCIVPSGVKPVSVLYDATG